ncbi:uncharacterized protein G2W53_017427 [Senna tora]|uniref:Uncharacterized protein n=1 Tax=Senna tora TaxID=362788 RepID=A0A834WMF5_9FABA|nr:uncharacterized protein G2W53_017427 [Senna tora]
MIAQVDFTKFQVYSNKASDNDSQCNSGFQGASYSMQVCPSSSQENNSTMILPYELDSSSKNNDMQVLLKGMVDLKSSMENQIVYFGKQCETHISIAEKGMCSHVSSVQARLRTGLEARNKVEEQNDHTPATVPSDELAKPSIEITISNPSLSSNLINSSYTSEHLIDFAPTCDARKSVNYKHDGLAAKPDGDEPDPIFGKVDVQLKKPLDN